MVLHLSDVPNLVAVADTMALLFLCNRLQMRCLLLLNSQFARLFI
uniref:Uncharacterized protein n=1 Tax=Arundo donax TaxID=35708 RepID=A0A0A9FR66_ARUDO